MNEFMNFDVVSVNARPLLSVFLLQEISSFSVSSRSIRLSEIMSYESVASYEHAGSPNTRLTLSNGDVLYVKQHVKTVAEKMQSVQ